MQQRVNLVEHIGDRRLRLGPRRTVLAALQHRLGELQMPVAEDVPDEAIGGVGGVVEAIGFDRRATSPTALAVSPRIQRLSGSRTARGIEAGDRARQPFISAKREAFQSLVAKLR